MLQCGLNLGSLLLSETEETKAPLKDLKLFSASQLFWGKIWIQAVGFHTFQNQRIQLFFKRRGERKGSKEIVQSAFLKDNKGSLTPGTCWGFTAKVSHCPGVWECPAQSTERTEGHWAPLPRNVVSWGQLRMSPVCLPALSSEFLKSPLQEWAAPLPLLPGGEWRHGDTAGLA